MPTSQILSVNPAFGVPGGEVVIECVGFDTTSPEHCAVLFNDAVAPIVGLSPKRVLAIVPESTGGAVEVRLQSANETSAPANITVAKRLASDLHPVTNPAFNPDDGALFVTRSGSRGEQLPITLFRIDVGGEVTEFSGDIPNPTGIAFSSEREMFVSSRLEGVIYRVTPFKEAVAFARNLGVATGVAFDSSGDMFVGDRSGTIYRVNGIGEAKVWAEIEPSVSAYHLALGPDGHLYVSGPTVTSFDVIWRIDPEGRPDVFFKGLGRPQGLAFDQAGHLYVAASYRGRRGIVRISPDGAAKIVVAGVNLVGLAFSASGELALASIDSVYSLPMGIKGVLLS